MSTGRGGRGGFTPRGGMGRGGFRGGGGRGFRGGGGGGRGVLYANQYSCYSIIPFCRFQRRSWEILKSSNQTLSLDTVLDTVSPIVHNLGMYVYT